MPAPSELAIATKAVERLAKEERYYQSEQVRQQERVQKLEEEIKKGGADLDPNAEFILRQEVGFAIPPATRHARRPRANEITSLHRNKRFRRRSPSLSRSRNAQRPR